jgi:sigma-E factor negative regulatory protein RseA
MSNKDKESLSALIDNEIDDLELRRLLKAVELDAELRSTWERMNLVQAVLHDDNVQHSTVLPHLGNNLANRVADVIANEPGQTEKPAQLGDWGKSFAKIGIAASVALAFFLGMQTTMIEPGPAVAGVVPVAQQSEAEYVSVVAQNSDSSAVELAVQQVDPEARQRLEDYIKSVSIRAEEPVQLEQLQDSPLYRLVNEIQNNQ